MLIKSEILHVQFLKSVLELAQGLISPLDHRLQLLLQTDNLLLQVTYCLLWLGIILWRRVQLLLQLLHLFL